MTAGKLSVSPLTIHGLPQNGFPTSQTFIGCYVSPSEKQRTNSESGPEPHFKDTLQCNVGENDHTLSFDVINEDPARPGHIGSAQLPLASVFDSGRFEDWVPLSTSSGSPLGFIYIKLNFTPSQPKENTEGPYRVPPPPPSYPGQGFAEDKKIEVPEHSNVSESSMSYGQQTRENSSGSFNHSIPPPAYNPPVDSHGPPTPGPSTPGMYDPNSNPMSPSTPGSAPPPFMAVCPPGPVPTPGSSTPDVYNPNSNPMSPSTSGSVPPPFLAVCPPGPVPTSGTPPVVTPLTEKEKKKGVPDWMKYGGAALAGATAVGLGSWAVNSFNDSDEEAEEAEKRAQQESLQRTMQEESYRSEQYQVQPPQQEYMYQPENYQTQAPPPVFVPQEVEEEEIQEEVEEEAKEESEKESSSSEEEEEEAEEEAEEEEEQAEEEEAEEEEEQAEEEAEEEEEEEEEAEEHEGPVINDSKWR